MKKILKFLIIIPLIIAMIVGIYYAFINYYGADISEKKVKRNVFSNLQQKRAELTEFFVYGTSLNITGRVSGIEKQNVETVKLLLTDGLGYEKIYKMDYEFIDDMFVFTNSNEINTSIDLEELDANKYYLILRLKLNNSVNYKYYSLENKTQYSNLEYYTITRENSNNKVDILFENMNFNNNEIPYMAIAVKQSELPENVYDIVIDAGHGGQDKGERSGDYVEADITLDYALSLKSKLEEKGYKIKLTREGKEDEKKITAVSMYDDDGRINVAQESKAKLLISLHVNNGSSSSSGIEVYAPSKSDLTFAKSIADNVVSNVDGIEYSDNSQYKIKEGVYVKNFTKSLIEAFNLSLEKQEITPYDIKPDTPYLYTIREVGGIATNAYVDGRNSTYGKNKYINSNIGLEAYQIEMGYIKTDAETLVNNKDIYIESLAQTIDNYKKSK